ncbi:hypothetical protein QTG54_000846 [Skeletonema marinoi]|uniref:Uncharacterized protein n=1 Tax=Skeletonema marinoi TaxID=267567 RepID=A0AAD8YMT9_9STRA|nr:hypothetical protein QTG54_000846 [Skeletonema marinoi]
MNASTRLEDIEETSEFVIDLKMFILVNNPGQMFEQKLTFNKRRAVIHEAFFIIEGAIRSDEFKSSSSHCICHLLCERLSSPERISSDDDDENTDNNISFNKSILKTKKQRAGLFEGDLAMHHAQELLNIATHQLLHADLFDESVSFDSNNSILSTIQEERSFIKDDSRATNKAKSFSFAMRNRAMRVASILCPHDVLLRVLTEEGLVSKITDDVINKFTFASFVASEIEAMGLPLPHSDLLDELFLFRTDYLASSWWRLIRGLSGRFYLLLLNLCINNQLSIDWELFVSIFSELKRLELPRSLLLACECAVQSNALELAAQRNELTFCRASVMLLILSPASSSMR